MSETPLGPRCYAKKQRPDETAPHTCLRPKGHDGLHQCNAPWEGRPCGYEWTSAAPVSEAAPTPETLLEQINRVCPPGKAIAAADLDALVIPIPPARASLESALHTYRREAEALRARVAALTTDRTALATLRDAVKEHLTAEREWLNMLGSNTAPKVIAAASRRCVAATDALAALTADHEEGGT